MYKSADKDLQNVKSYQPISLLNIQGKIIERVMYTHLKQNFNEQ